MKITKNDLKLTKSEYQKALKILNTKTVLTYDAEHFQCGDCHHVYKRELNTCPKCGCYPEKTITKGRTRYDVRTMVQTFRKVGKHVIELVFMFCDTQNKGFNRNITLVRKTEYKDNIKVFVNNKLSYEPMNHVFSLWDYHGSYYGYYKREGWSKEKPANIKGYSLGFSFVSMNNHVLLEHPLLNRVYSNANINEITNKEIEQAFKYPYLLEMLHKRSKRHNIYYGLGTIKRYKRAYLKYHNYFERYGNFNPRLLQKLNKAEGMLKYNTFKKLMAFDQIPKGIKTKEDLEKYSNIVSKRDNGYRYDRRTYEDYIGMAAERGLDISSDKVKFNSKWEQLHDRWMNEAQLEEALKKEKKFTKIYSKFKDEYIDGVFIQAPHSIKDLFYESEKLHHCVKSYTDRIIKKSSLIFFIRINPGEPFITAEVIEGKIVQARGLKNNTNMIKDEHKKALNKYLRKYIGRESNGPGTNQASY